MNSRAASKPVKTDNLKFKRRVERTIKIKYVIDLIQKLIGKGLPQYGAVPYRLDENMELYADVSKAKKLLSWESSIGLEDGLKDMIAQY